VLTNSYMITINNETRIRNVELSHIFAYKKWPKYNKISKSLYCAQIAKINKID